MFFVKTMWRLHAQAVLMHVRHQWRCTPVLSVRSGLGVGRARAQRPLEPQWRHGARALLSSAGDSWQKIGEGDERDRDSQPPGRSEEDINDAKVLRLFRSSPQAAKDSILLSSDEPHPDRRAHRGDVFSMGSGWWELIDLLDVVGVKYVVIKDADYDEEKARKAREDQQADEDEDEDEDKKQELEGDADVEHEDQVDDGLAPSVRLESELAQIGEPYNTTPTQIKRRAILPPHTRTRLEECPACVKPHGGELTNMYTCSMRHNAEGAATVSCFRCGWETDNAAEVVVALLEKYATPEIREQLERLYDAEFSASDDDMLLGGDDEDDDGEEEGGRGEEDEEEDVEDDEDEVDLDLDLEPEFDYGGKDNAEDEESMEQYDDLDGAHEDDQDNEWSSTPAAESEGNDDDSGARPLPGGKQNPRLSKRTQAAIRAMFYQFDEAAHGYLKHSKESEPFHMAARLLALGYEHEATGEPVPWPASEAMAFLTSRGISGRTAVAYGVGIDVHEVSESLGIPVEIVQMQDGTWIERVPVPDYEVPQSFPRLGRGPELRAAALERQRTQQKFYIRGENEHTKRAGQLEPDPATTEVEGTKRVVKRKGVVPVLTFPWTCRPSEFVPLAARLTPALWDLLLQEPWREELYLRQRMENGVSRIHTYFPWPKPWHECFFTPRYKLRGLRDKAVQATLPEIESDMVEVAGGLFGWHLVPDEARSIVITEGEIDAMSIYEATGVPAVSLPSGINSIPDSILPDLARFDEIILWFDNDRAGLAGTPQILSDLGVDRCKIVHPVNGCKDANEALLAGASIRQVLLTAPWVATGDVMALERRPWWDWDIHELGLPRPIVEEYEEYDKARAGQPWGDEHKTYRDFRVKILRRLRHARAVARGDEPMPLDRRSGGEFVGMPDDDDDEDMDGDYEELALSRRRSRICSKDSIPRASGKWRFPTSLSLWAIARGFRAGHWAVGSDRVVGRGGGGVIGTPRSRCSG